MTELQSKLVDILSWFHDICDKHQLRYYIIGGTMLGAVRHKGFIPWDDDVDVGMPRSDYERLRELSATIKDSKYIIEYPDYETKENPYLIAKVYDTQTTLIEKQRYAVKRGIYLDVFPLDGIGNTMDEAIENYREFNLNFRLNQMISGAFLKRRALYKNIAVLCGRIISPLFIDKWKLAKKIDNICKRMDFDNTEIVSNLLGGSYIKGFIPREHFGEPTLIQFEDLMVYGLEQPHLYLESIYGDYMTLPPEEKRVSLHDNYYCNLNESYLSRQ